MSNDNIMAFDWGVRLLAQDGIHHIDVLYSQGYTANEQTLLTNADIGSMAFGLIGGTSGIWEKITNSGTPTADWKKLANLDDVQAAIDGLNAGLANSSWRVPVSIFTDETVAQIETALNLNTGAGVYQGATLTSGARIIRQGVSSVYVATKTGSTWALSVDSTQRVSTNGDVFAIKRGTYQNKLAFYNSNTNEYVLTLNDYDYTALETLISNVENTVSWLESNVEYAHLKFSTLLTNNIQQTLFTVNAANVSGIEFTYTADSNGLRDGSENLIYGSRTGKMMLIIPHHDSTHNPSFSRGLMLETGVTIANPVFTVVSSGTGASKTISVKAQLPDFSEQYINGYVSAMIPRGTTSLDPVYPGYP